MTCIHEYVDHTVDRYSSCKHCHDVALIKRENEPEPFYRMEWDVLWMNMAFMISERSHDKRLRVGAIIVDEDNCQMLANGYNGRAKGEPNVPVSLEPGRSGCVHAEMNAIIKHNSQTHKRCKMYVTNSPCLDCARAIINANIRSVMYSIPYRDMSGVELLKSSGIHVRVVTPTYVPTYVRKDESTQ